MAELSQFETEGAPAPQSDQWQINLRCSTVKGWKLDQPAAEGWPDVGEFRAATVRPDWPTLGWQDWQWPGQGSERWQKVGASVGA